ARVANVAEVGSEDRRYRVGCSFMERVGLQPPRVNGISLKLAPVVMSDAQAGLLSFLPAGNAGAG
ncbi:MAG TPA: hypothetical protein PK867_16070, partial [Pirellulales bacterium]|nr:hypothetical protein [Pirellulales bacterium]